MRHRDSTAKDSKIPDTNRVPSRDIPGVGCSYHPGNEVKIRLSPAQARIRVAHHELRNGKRTQVKYDTILPLMDFRTPIRVFAAPLHKPNMNRGRPKKSVLKKR